jgi:hypothetical protein
MVTGPRCLDWLRAGGAPGQQAEALAQPLDILVGTPQKLTQHAAKVGAVG